MLIAMFCLLGFALAQSPQPERIAVIAHRAAHIRNPENSLSSIRAAIELGADYVELDVRTTLDGRLVLMHDATVDRTTNGNGAVAQMTFKQVGALKLGHEHVPTFEEALDIAHGKIDIYVDAKSLTPAALVHALESHDMQGNVVVYAPPVFLKSLLSLQPEIKRMPEAVNADTLRTNLMELRPSVIAFNQQDFLIELIAAAKSAHTGIFVDRLGEHDNSEAWQDAIQRGATGIQTDKPGELVQFLRTRNLHDVLTQHKASAYEYYRGGNNVDDAFRWLIRKSGGGDVVILSASGSDDYNRYIQNLGPVNSVGSIVIKSRAASSDPFVLDKVRQAAAIFITGGDQWNYIRYWKGTPLATAIHEAVKRGVPIGGTSASLAIQGQYSFSAEMETITSAQALANPFDLHLTLESSFLKLPNLEGVITDSHFSRRDRFGRLLAFLARIAQDTGAAKGVGIDERTAILLEPDGSATVTGEGAAYFVSSNKKPEVCTPDKPLTYEDLSVYRVPAAGKFNFQTWTGQGGESYRLSAIAGIIFSSQKNGFLY